jgi:hypothetical protein
VAASKVVVLVSSSTGRANMVISAFNLLSLKHLSRTSHKMRIAFNSPLIILRDLENF